MTRKKLYKNIEVVKGYYLCRICNAESDFVIVNPNIHGSESELPLCKKCAEMLKSKIDIGMTM